MSKIVKTKFLCKNGMRVGKGIDDKFWIDKFIAGKWYDGEY